MRLIRLWMKQIIRQVTLQFLEAGDIGRCQESSVEERALCPPIGKLVISIRTGVGTFLLGISKLVAVKES